MNRFWRIVIYIGLPFSIIGTIACICVLFRKTSILGFDYIGLIVGILAFMETILLGWNIWYALEVKKEVTTKIQDSKEEYRKHLNYHEELNKKDFDNIIDALKRAEAYCKKLDDINCKLIEILKQNGINPNKPIKGYEKMMEDKK